MVGDRCGIVIHSIRNHRPTVIVALLNDVEFVPTAWTMLGLPHLASDRAEREALWIAMAVTPDAGNRAWLVAKRVVFRNAAIVLYAVYLSVGSRQILFVARRGPISNGEK
jgi:hypothetical protein